MVGRLITICLYLVFLSMQAVPATRWAIVVGIADYQSEDIQDLRYTARDAATFQQVLVEECGVDSDHVWLFLNSEATKQNIERAFAELTRLAAPEDTVFIYFSGHGSFINDSDGDEADGDGLDEVFLPYDAKPGLENTYIVDDILGYWISRLRAGSVVLFLDFCHSGGQGRGVNIMDLPVRGASDSMARDVFTDPDAKPGRVVLSACKGSQVAYESSDLRHGVFTYFLVQGIRYKLADLNYDREVSIGELANYVITEVTNWANQSGLIQTPVYENPSAKEIVVVPNIPTFFTDTPSSTSTQTNFSVNQKMENLERTVQWLQITNTVALILALAALFMVLFW